MRYVGNVCWGVVRGVGRHDQGFIEEAVRFNAGWIAKLTQAFEALGLEVTPSVGNFLLIHFPRQPGRTAAEADAVLMSRGVIVRGVANYGLPDALRLSVGTEEANRLVVSALADFLAQPR